MLDVYSATPFRTATGDLPFELPEVDVSGVAADPVMDEDNTEWLRENYPEIENHNREEYPASANVRPD